MKTKLIIVLFIILCCNCNSQEIVVKKTIQKSIVGKWRICTYCNNGLEAHPNNCPEISFFENGEGTLEASEPSSEFQWNVYDNQIFFYFKTDLDKESFLSNNFVYSFNIYQERGSTFLKLIINDSNSWFLLIK